MLKRVIFVKSNQSKLVSDLTPDYHVEQQKLVVQIMTLQANMARSKLEIMQLDGRKISAVENIAASKKAVDDCEERLRGLEETHGKLEDSSD